MASGQPEEDGMVASWSACSTQRQISACLHENSSPIVPLAVVPLRHGNMRIPVLFALAALSAIISLPPAFTAEDELVGAKSAIFADNLVQGLVGLTFDRDGYMYVA